MNDRLDELIALAALGELSAGETAELDALLADDPAAADELADALGVAATLQSSDTLEPPPELRASVLAAIASIEQLPVPNDAVPGGSTGVTPPPPISPPGPVPVPLDEARRRHRRSAVLAAAAAVVLIAIGGLFVANRDSGGDDPIAAVLDADDVTVRTLEGSLGTTLEVAYSADESAMVLTGDDVPAVAEDETYQVWLVDESGAQPGGTFRPDAAGHVALRVDADPSGFVVGVTLEPSGGSEQPTLPLVASG
ncbi:MAG: anti-sigma factor [Ilumatobacteraceae bacterium]